MKRKREEKSKTELKKELKSREDDVTQKPILSSEPNVKAGAVFILENASLTKGYVRKV